MKLSTYVLIVRKKKNSKKKKRKRMDGLKKQLEIVFSMNTSTLKMTVEHFKIQQPIIENNKLKEENATFGPRSS